MSQLLHTCTCVCFGILSIQAPIKVFGVEGRYAHALFSAAAQKNAIETVEKELTDFQVYLVWDLSVSSMGLHNCYTCVLSPSL